MDGGFGILTLPGGDHGAKRSTVHVVPCRLTYAHDCRGCLTSIPQKLRYLEQRKIKCALCIARCAGPLYHRRSICPASMPLLDAKRPCSRCVLSTTTFQLVLQNRDRSELSWAVRSHSINCNMWPRACIEFGSCRGSCKAGDVFFWALLGPQFHMYVCSEIE